MTRAFCLVATLTALSVPVWGQALDGEAVYAEHCSQCHAEGKDPRAPGLEALRARRPEAVVEALVSGAMRIQGARLSGPQRRAVAEFLTGRPLGGDVAGTSMGRCTADNRAAVAAGSAWSGWGGSPRNGRFQPAQAAGLTVAQVPRLTLKWAFGFADASSAWAQPSVAGGRVYVGSQNGTVYALDAETGCSYWSYSARGGVRTAISIGPRASAERGVTSSGRATVYFGDTTATAYALNADTGEEIWTRRVDDHPLARITGAPTLHDGRLYVPTSSYEEAQAGNPAYPCCTFRGSVSALDAAAGSVVWKHYVIEQEPTQQTANGRAPFGPAGAAIWSSPTIDAARRRLYVGTGNAYSGPPTSTTNAVVALDLATGATAWTRQLTPNDIWVVGCGSGSKNPNCPPQLGEDIDFGQAPMLAAVPGGGDLLVIGQKSGVGWALDPDRQGDVVWQYRAGRGGLLGGMEWGSAVDGEKAYFPVSDMNIVDHQPGGLHAVELKTGRRAWFAPPQATCNAPGCNSAQSAAITAIPGVVFSGANDGWIRGYATATGSVLWAFDTNRTFTTVNGVPAKGASIIGPGPVVAGGMLYVNSGYGGFGGRPGNVLLAFGME